MYHKKTNANVGKYTIVPWWTYGHPGVDHGSDQATLGEVSQETNARPLPLGELIHPNGQMVCLFGDPIDIQGASTSLRKCFFRPPPPNKKKMAKTRNLRRYDWRIFGCIWGWCWFDNDADKTTTTLVFCVVRNGCLFLRGIILVFFLYPFVPGCVEVVCMLFQYFGGLVKK